MGAADALSHWQGSRGQTVSVYWHHPRQGAASQDRAAGAASPQLCSRRQAVCSHLNHLRGDMASLRLHQALGTQGAVLTPGFAALCLPPPEQNSPGETQVAGDFYSCLVNQDLLPTCCLQDRSEATPNSQEIPWLLPMPRKQQRLLLHLHTCRAQPFDSIFTHVLKTMEAWACQQCPYTQKCTSSTAKAGEWAAPYTMLTPSKLSWLQACWEAVKCSFLTFLGLAVCSSGPKPNLTTFKPVMNHVS